ncbi:hypothetical protein N9L68_05690 [bacterium]|nr:hypothetical protein [bacterium]
MDMTDVAQIVSAQREVIEYQRELLRKMSPAPSTASMQDPIDGQLADHCRKLTLDTLKGKEEMVLYRGEYLRSSVFNAIEKADDERRKAVPKAWYKSETSDVQFRLYKHKDNMDYTCEECNGYWVNTASAPTTVGSTEIVSPCGSVEMVDAEVGSSQPTAEAWKTISPLPKGVLQEWQLRPMCIPVASAPPRVECGVCRATWVEAERITAVGGM